MARPSREGGRLERRQVRAEVAARAFQGMYVPFTLAETVFGDREVRRLTLEEIADEVVRLFLHGALNHLAPASKSSPERSHHATNS